MKKILFLIIMIVGSTKAQIIVSPNPFGLESGTITLTYGSLGDYSIFDPFSDPNLYLYTGLETDGITSTWDFHDTWSDVGTLIPLTWSSADNAYVATFNIATRNYYNEATASTTSIPSGTTVNNWYFIIRNFDGSRQSSDLVGTNYGFQTSTLSMDTLNDENSIYISNGVIYSKLENLSEVKIFNLKGQKISEFVIYENEEIIMNLPKNEIFIAQIKNNKEYYLKKFKN